MRTGGSGAHPACGLAKRDAHRRHAEEDRGPVRVIVASVCSAVEPLYDRRSRHRRAASRRCRSTGPRRARTAPRRARRRPDPRAIASAAFRAAARMPPWVRTAPFDRPVVPEVKSTTAGSRGSARNDLPDGIACHPKLIVDERDRRRRHDPLLDLGRSEQNVERDGDRARARRAPK